MFCYAFSLIYGRLGQISKLVQQIDCECMGVMQPRGSRSGHNYGKTNGIFTWWDVVRGRSGVFDCAIALHGLQKLRHYRVTAGDLLIHCMPSPSHIICGRSASTRNRVMGACDAVFCVVNLVLVLAIGGSLYHLALN